MNLLIANWKDSWKLYSMRMAALVTLFGIAGAVIPQLRAFMSPEVYAIITAVLGILTGVARLLLQSTVKDVTDAATLIASSSIPDASIPKSVITKPATDTTANTTEPTEKP